MFTKPRQSELSWLLAILLATASLSAQNPDPDIFQQLEYRQIGPLGNRVSAVIGVPGDSNTYYIGAASGGVWKTSDGGATWTPVFDDQPAQSIGALALSASDPNVVWPRIVYAGMWQMVIWTWGRQSGGPGSGLYKSTDAGETWKKLEGQGLPKETWGKVALSMSGDRSDRVYALIETNSHRDFEPLSDHQGVL